MNDDAVLRGDENCKYYTNAAYVGSCRSFAAATNGSLPSSKAIFKKLWLNRSQEVVVTVGGEARPLA